MTIEIEFCGRVHRASAARLACLAAACGGQTILGVDTSAGGAAGADGSGLRTAVRFCDPGYVGVRCARSVP